MDDTHYDKVVLLLPMNGANDGVTFTDWSPAPKTITREGNTKTTTAQSKYYGSSAYFDGSGDYLSCAAIPPLLVGNIYTMEAWVRRVAGATGQESIFSFHTSSGANVFVVTLTNVFGTTFSTFTLHPVEYDVWTHLAVVRLSDTMKIFVNGILRHTVSVGANPIGATDLFTLGQEYDNGPTPSDFFLGYMQDVRITNGVARYSTDFTPPDKLIGSVSGTVYDVNGDPAARKIVAWPRLIHPPVAPHIYTTTSSAEDGTYSLTVPATDLCRVVLADEATLYNDIIDRVIPE